MAAVNIPRPKRVIAVWLLLATGMLFPAGDARALARTIMDLLDHPDQWPRLKANGRHFVESERTWKVSVSNYIPVYQGLRGASA